MTFPRKSDAVAAAAACAASGVLASSFLPGGRAGAAFSVCACASLALPALAASGLKPRTLLAAWVGAALPAILLSPGEGLKGAAVAGAATVLWAGLCAVGWPVLRSYAGAALTPVFFAAYAAPFWAKPVAPRLTDAAFRLSPFAVLASGSNVYDLRTHGIMYELGPGTDYAFSMPSFWVWVPVWALVGGALVWFRMHRAARGARIEHEAAGARPGRP